FGPRSTFGFFIQPMSREFTWGRDIFGLALALQNLLWGLGQPLAGAIADRFGSLRVIAVGALLYAGGLVMMRYAATPLSLDLGAGVLIGFGLSGCSFNLVLSAFAKLLPPERISNRSCRRWRKLSVTDHMCCWCSVSSPAASSSPSSRCICPLISSTAAFPLRPVAG